MKKIELVIDGLSYSQTQPGSYVLILIDPKSNITLPVIVNSNDAQYITLSLEGIKTSKISIYEVIRKITQFKNIKLKNVLITHVIEGIFYTTLNFQGDSPLEIDCSIGDAVCLALLYNCPILCSKDILDLMGVLIDDNGNIIEDKENSKKSDVSLAPVSVESLESQLKKALENEEYEVASQIRDRIQELKNNK